MTLRELTVDADPSFLAALSDLDREEWNVFTRHPWMHVRPTPEPATPRQGWKLHLSATPANAAVVLERVVPVAAAHKVAFKVLATEALVAESTAPTAPRGSAGKFITIYPPDDSSCRTLAAALDAATEDLTGPAILSDKRYRHESLVHYRYGGFQARLVVDDDGQLHHVLRAPNGDLWFDERNAWFSPPPWAPDPFAPSTSPQNSPAESDDATSSAPRRTDRLRAPVLLGGRFLAKEALKHANGGGVYVAEDTRDGGLVVVKEARPSVGAASDGTDKRLLLEREAQLLQRAASSGAVPVLIDEFAHGGHHFLVEQHLDGEPLRLYVRGMWANAPAGPPVDVALDLARALVVALRTIHEAGVVVGDFTPNNLIVWPADRRVAVVDLEIGQSDDLPPLQRRQLGTPGYATFDGRPSHVVTAADDAFGCGATLFFVVTGRDPAFVDMNAGAAVEYVERVRWLRALGPTCPAAAALAPLIHGLTAPNGSERWPLDRAADWLDSGVAGPVSSWEGPAERVPAAPPSVIDSELDVRDLLRSVVDDTVAAFADGMRDGDWPWSVSSEFEDSDPANLQGGASGVGLFLVTCAQSFADARALEVATEVGRRVRASFERSDLRGPSLYFGAAGSLWFLLELGVATHDNELVTFALERTADLPRAVRNPDVCHGTAGLGLTALHAWLRCGDGALLGAAMDAAAVLVERAAPHRDGYLWPIPDDAWSSMAGKTFFGFAHGAAGIAYYLLLAARAADEMAMQQLALDAIRGLAGEAKWVGEEAYWLSGPDAEMFPEGYWPHWCNGSSGIGTAMVRAYRVTGEERLSAAAYGAARAVVSHRWRWGVSQCHGTAGNAELLLDLEAWSPSPEAESLTNAVVERLVASVRPWAGRRLLFDNPDRPLVAGFNTGAAGAAALCLRWLTRGPRLLMLDELLDLMPRRHAEGL